MVFDLKKQLKQHDNGLLQQLFAERGELEDVSWSTLKKTEVNPIIAGIRSLSPCQRRQIQVLLQSIAKLADNRGLKVVQEELSQRHPEMVPTWGGAEKPGRQGAVGVPECPRRLRRGGGVRPRRRPVGDAVLQSTEPGALRRI